MQPAQDGLRLLKASLDRLSPASDGDQDKVRRAQDWTGLAVARSAALGRCGGHRVHQIARRAPQAQIAAIDAAVANVEEEKIERRRFTCAPLA